ncbi:MAG: phosphoribosyl-ATP diphosphatase [Rhodospirillales bacterium]|nr:phosphoribosyl-ATP diphosphatase [Rhodospirillales bacterium]
MADSQQNALVLERLFKVIESRRSADADSSYTARLFDKGPAKIAQKVGEEAVETVIAALGEDRDALASESADLLYHLLVLWAARGLNPAEIWAALEKREGVSGLEEKASRGES